MARTVGHAHRLLHIALARAVATETLARNVASAISPPKVKAKEVVILNPDQLTDVLRKLRGHSLETIVALEVASGLRRDEVLGLRLGGRRSRGQHHPGRALARGDQGRIALQGSEVGQGQAHHLFADVGRGHAARPSSWVARAAAGKPDDGALLFPNDPEGAPIPPTG